MSNNILDDVAGELLNGVDLDGMSAKAKDKLFEEVMDNLYYRIILKSIELVDGSKKDNLISDLQNVKDDANTVMETLHKYLPNMEDVIVQVMGEYKEELNKEYGV